jgi:pimeloyl-ACP methyl ester carboxylesterase
MATATLDRFVEVQSGRLRTRVFTAGSGDPVVFLHGAGGLTWDPFLDDLAERFTVYAPEHPGCGESRGVEALEGIWDLVLYYYDLFDALGLRAPAVVGHSFGGMVAAELASCNPERVKRLALIAPIGLWRDDVPVADWIGIDPARLPELIFTDPNGTLAKQAFSLPEEPEAKMTAQFQMAMNLASTSQFVWPLPDKGLRKRIHRATQPTLIVWGAQDRLAPVAYAEEFRSRLPNAEVVVVDDAGHVPQLEQREQVSRALLDFLGR